jgi:hypothetical protein
MLNAATSVSKQTYIFFVMYIFKKVFLLQKCMIYLMLYNLLLFQAFEPNHLTYGNMINSKTIENNDYLQVI